VSRRSLALQVREIMEQMRCVLGSLSRVTLGNVQGARRCWVMTSEMSRAQATPRRTRQVALADLGERLSSLRLCDDKALAVMRASLERHGQLSALTLYEQDGSLEILDGFKRLRAARAGSVEPGSARGAGRARRGGEAATARGAQWAGAQ